MRRIAGSRACAIWPARVVPAHRLMLQPFHFSDFQTGMDPHISSGIPNLAFCTAAKAIGGKSWETVGQIWYKALTSFAPNPSMTMKTFANRARQLATQMDPANATVANAIDAGLDRRRTIAEANGVWPS